MDKKSRRIVVMVGWALILSLSGLPALAQEKPAEDMQLVREKVKADKKLSREQDRCSNKLRPRDQDTPYQVKRTTVCPCGSQEGL
jgi:hypothetical protein